MLIGRSLFTTSGGGAIVVLASLLQAHVNKRTLNAMVKFDFILIINFFILFSTIKNRKGFLFIAL